MSETVSAAPTQSRAPEALLITTVGIGDFLRGGSFAEASEQLGGPGSDDRCPWVLGGRTNYATWVIGGQENGVVDGSIELVAIDSFGFPAAASDAPMTAEGIGLGSTPSEVRAAYPTAVDEEPRHVEEAIRYTDADGSIVFQIREGVVQGITVLAVDAEQPWEYCG